MDRKLANNLLAKTMWSMYANVESTCLQKPNVHNSTFIVEEHLRGFVDLWGLGKTRSVQGL